METTLVILKPDAMARGLAGEIIARFERVGLTLVGVKLVTPSKDQIANFYPSDENWFRIVGEKSKKSYEAKGIKDDRDPIAIGKNVKQMILDYMVAGPVLVMAWKGNDAVLVVRKLVGSTDPFMAAPGTIRGDFTCDSFSLSDKEKRSVRNIIHASGAADEAEKEVAFWFTKDEIVNYSVHDAKVLFDPSWGKK